LQIARPKAGLLHFNPGARLSLPVPHSDAANRQSLRRQDAFIATLEMGNRHLDSFVLRIYIWTLR
jgi:hypothetical protein